MSSINYPSSNVNVTYGGGMASPSNDPVKKLERVVMCCMLWENTFYVDGTAAEDIMRELAMKVPAHDLSRIALEAKINQKLRHVPLLLTCYLFERKDSRHLKLTQLVYDVITRADDLTELVSLWWRNGKKPLPSALKKGLAKAFTKFDAYQLAKYNRDKAVKLRDVMFMVHPKPLDDTQKETFKKLADKTLESPDTWEVRLSSGEDKKQVFTDLIQRDKLGDLAFMRNLRNMIQSNVDIDLIAKRFDRMTSNTKLLPFQFLQAAKMVPQLENHIDVAMLKTLLSPDKLEGLTCLLVDVSGSMDTELSGKSQIKRTDAAAGIAILVRNIANCNIFTFSDRLVQIPARNGMALRDAILHSQPMSGTYLAKALTAVPALHSYKRIIIITDEQTHDGTLNFPRDSHVYIINVGTYQNGVDCPHKQLVRINGFSEHAVNYICKLETEQEKN